MTIKDQWANASHKSYSDRVQEQLSAMSKLVGQSFFIGGDFNCRIGHQETSFGQIGDFVDEHNLCWPTRGSDRSVLHVIHSNDLRVQLDTLDDTVRYPKQGTSADKHRGLSDHPFLIFAVERK